MLSKTLQQRIKTRLICVCLAALSISCAQTSSKTQSRTDASSDSTLLQQGLASFQNGQAPAEELKEACDLFEQAAELGNAWARHQLAFCFLSGKGRDKDKVEAAKHYQTAFDAGFESSALTLGTLYVRDFETPAKHKRGVEILSGIADRDFSGIANFTLGEAKIKGLGTEVDHFAGLQHFARSANVAHPLSIVFLIEVFRIGLYDAQPDMEASRELREAYEALLEMDSSGENIPPYAISLRALQQMELLP